MSNVKKIKTINILLFIVFILIAIMSIILTVLFIRPPTIDSEQEQTTSEIVYKEDGKEESTGNLEGNLLQHYNNSEDYGLVASNNKYVFKYEKLNNKDCLTRTDLKDMSKDIILTGYKVKNLIIINKNLYFIMEQYTDNSKSQVIAYMNIDKETLNTINSTRVKEIISFVSDGKNLYYTTGSDYNIYKVNEDNVVETVCSTKSTGENPFIIGIKEGKIYYVNGIELCKVGINSRQKEIISNEYCSTEQYPILTENYIYCFYDLEHTRLDVIDHNGNFVKTIFNLSEQTQIQSRIDSMNYSCGYIFLLSNKKIYYIGKEDNSINLLSEANANTNQMYFTDEQVILEDKEYGNVVAHKIVWLLAT